MENQGIRDLLSSLNGAIQKGIQNIAYNKQQGNIPLPIITENQDLERAVIESSRRARELRQGVQELDKKQQAVDAYNRDPGNEWIPIKPQNEANTIAQLIQPTAVPNSADYLETTVLPITRKYNIPDAIAAGQFAAEGRGQHKYAQNPYNNPFNINAVDSNPNAAYRYATPEQGVEAYADLISNKYRQALETDDLVKALEYIQNSGYAGDPQTYQQRSDNGYNSYVDFIMNTPEWKYYSQQQV